MSGKNQRHAFEVCSGAALLLIAGCGGQTASAPGHSAAGASGASSGGTAGTGGQSGDSAAGGTGAGGTTAGSGGSSAGADGGLPQSADCNAWIALPEGDPAKTSKTDIVGTCGLVGFDCVGGYVCCFGLCAMNHGKCFPVNQSHNIVDCYTPMCVSPESCYPGGIVTPQ
jgi:hypothetical protein